MASRHSQARTQQLGGTDLTRSLALVGIGAVSAIAFAWPLNEEPEDAALPPVIERGTVMPPGRAEGEDATIAEHTDIVTRPTMPALGSGVLEVRLLHEDGRPWEYLPVRIRLQAHRPSGQLPSDAIVTTSAGDRVRIAGVERGLLWTLQAEPPTTGVFRPVRAPGPARPRLAATIDLVEDGSVPILWVRVLEECGSLPVVTARIEARLGFRDAEGERLSNEWRFTLDTDSRGFLRLRAPRRMRPAEVGRLTVNHGSQLAITTLPDELGIGENHLPDLRLESR